MAAKSDAAPAAQELPNTQNLETSWSQVKQALAEGGPLLSDEVARCYIEDLANKVGRNFPGDIRQMLCDDALTELCRAIAPFEIGASFRPWAWTVLKNHALDLDRKTRRETALAIDIPDTTGGRSQKTEIAFDWLVERCRRLRFLLDAFVFFPNQAHEVDYYAVFTLAAQLRLAERLADAGEEDYLGGRNWEPGELQNCLLPWRPWELPRQVQIGWPRLDQLWRWIQSQSFTNPRPNSSDIIARACLDLAPGLEQGSASWNVLVNRAKERVRNRMSSEDWKNSFDTLFPTFKRKSGESHDD